MGTWELHTREFMAMGFDLVKSGEVPASGSINCFHLITPYLSEYNELDAIELHIHEEDILVKYYRDSLDDDWVLVECGSLEYAEA